MLTWSQNTLHTNQSTRKPRCWYIVCAYIVSLYFFYAIKNTLLQFPFTHSFGSECAKRMHACLHNFLFTAYSKITFTECSRRGKRHYRLTFPRHIFLSKSYSFTTKTESVPPDTVNKSTKIHEPQHCSGVVAAASWVYARKAGGVDHGKAAAATSIGCTLGIVYSVCNSYE